MTEHKETDPRVLQAFSDIDDAEDLMHEALSKTIGAKEDLISLGWREVKYVEGVYVCIIMVHPSLIQGLKELGLHIDECLGLFADVEHNAAQKLVNDNTHLWVQLPVAY